MAKKDRFEKRLVRVKKKALRKNSVTHYCEACDKTFARKWSKDRHDASYHNNDGQSNTPVSKPRCWMCSLQFDEMSTLVQHFIDEHNEPTEYELSASALKKSISKYNKNFNADVDPFDEDANALAVVCDSKHHDEIVSVLQKHLTTCSPSFKAALIINGLFKRVSDEDSTPISMVFRTDLHLVTPRTDLSNLIHKWLIVLDQRLEKITGKGSGNKKSFSFVNFLENCKYSIFLGYSLVKIQQSQIDISNCKGLSLMGHSNSLDLSGTMSFDYDF